jgi:hypothetical protein
VRAVAGLSGLSGLVGPGGGGGGSSGSQTRTPGVAVSNSARSPAVAWTQPGNVLADDANYASVTLLPGEVSEWLDCDQFGFAIPGGSTITSIVAEVKCYCTSGDGNGIEDTAKLLLQGANFDGSYGTGDMASGNSAVPGSEDTVSYGGAPVSTWGPDPTSGIVMEPSFGFRYAVENIDAVPVTFYINRIRMIVEWS